ncbi:LysR family transcriptional regulator [Elioraea rosea]|uniref:LysR family transcriptional regulator n=1 Tax=Elioraea rosea TaxID=2492390 RepID=UPI001185A633|nr:LysR family transcriptional regulator [Elioraea rosea]
MSFDLIDLRLFVLVAEEGSITAGAERAGLALAAASARIRGMEAALGTPLLLRGRRGVTPTLAGRTLADEARLVLGQMEQLKGALSGHARGRAPRGPLRGHVRLFANTAAAEEHLPDALAPWLAANPGVDLELEERQSEEVAIAVLQGRAEAGILSRAVAPQGLEILPFREDRLVVAAPRTHPLARRRGVTFREVLGHDLVGLAQESALGTYLAGHAARLGLAPRYRARLRGLDAACRMAARGVGLAVVPEIAAERARQGTGLAVIPLDEAWAIRPLVLCVRSLAALPLHARRLVEHLAAAASTGEATARRPSAPPSRRGGGGGRSA